MKNRLMQKEVLLMLHSSYAYGELTKVNAREGKPFSKTRKLDEAFVSSFIQGFLPYIFKKQTKDKVYLWQVQPGVSFLQLLFGELPAEIDKSLSIDPHNFLMEMCMN